MRDRMTRSEVIQQIIETGVIPVVRAASADEAMRAIDAIKEGGVSVLEITMTVPGAVRVIEEVAARYGSEALVGAGTVFDAETARACILAGAEFIVSPALNSGNDCSVSSLRQSRNAGRAHADRSSGSVAGGR